MSNPEQTTEAPLTWTDSSHWVETCWEAFKRNKVRRCGRCEKCKAGFEVEFERNKEVQQKNIQCLCGNVQSITYYP